MSASTTRPSGSRPTRRARCRARRASERTCRSAGTTTPWSCVEGLEPGSTTPYEVRLDGEVGLAAGGLRRSRRRGSARSDPEQPVRVAFGSCRYAPPTRSTGDDRFDADALDTYARRIAGLAGRASGRTRCCCWATRCTPTRPRRRPSERIRAAAGRPAPGRASRSRTSRSTPGSTTSRWADPEVRWLLSTVPTSMIFDDHDVRDDWNTSRLWRRDMQQTPWWQERIIGGAVVVLGLPAPRQPLAGGPRRRRALPAGARRRRGRRAAAARVRDRSRREADGHKGARWSYRRDFGDVRLLVIDSRCGRILDDDDRSMVGRTRSSTGSSASRRAGVRPPAGRHLAALAAPPGAARHRVVERGAVPTGRAGRRWRASARSCAGPPTSSTGRRSGSPSTGWPSCSAARSRRPRGVRPPSTRDGLRAVRRRAPPVRRRGELAGRRWQRGLPADLLAGAQLRAGQRADGLPDRLEPGGRSG